MLLFVSLLMMLLVWLLFTALVESFKLLLFVVIMISSLFCGGEGMFNPKLMLAPDAGFVVMPTSDPSMFCGLVGKELEARCGCVEAKSEVLGDDDDDAIDELLVDGCVCSIFCAAGF